MALAVENMQFIILNKMRSTLLYKDFYYAPPPRPPL